jgi:hypothetical protein
MATEHDDDMEVEEFDSSILDVSDDEVDTQLINVTNKLMGATDGLQDEEEQETQDEVDDGEETTTDDDSEEGMEASESDSEASETQDNTQGTLDYQRQLEELYRPFKANGKEMQITSIDDARTLMQMGANYNKKMAALKPNLKLVKLLEKNNLLDESKISYLIDLHNKNPQAIGKLIKDSNLDPLDIDTETADTYKPNTYTVSDKEVELDGILEEIRETEAFNTTAEIISNKWDSTSKKVLYENPRLIKLLNDHVSNGVYENISSIVERERMLGRLTNVSDIEAYKLVGDAINAKGGFNKPQNTGTYKPTPKPSNSNSHVKNLKKAASPTKSKPTSNVSTDFNPLSLSDEEFEKIASSKFI